MEQTATERELTENLSKCRCCFRMIVNLRGALQIDDKIQAQFQALTQIELVLSDCFSSRICQLCASDLQSFVDLKNDLIQKQTSLYSLAGLDFQDPAESINNEGEEIEEGDEIEGYEMEYETVIPDGYEMVEEIADTDFIETDEHPAQMQNDAVLKIEKVTSSQREEVILQENCYEDDDSKPYEYDSSTNKEMSMKEDEIECEICGIAVLQSQFDEHVDQMHTPTEIFCDKCNRSFQSTIALRKHVNEEHAMSMDKRSKKRKLHYCALCPKEYDYKKQLIDHVRSFHNRERNAECHICHRRFYHRDLKKHIEHVHGEKKLECEVCGKLYSCHDNLKLHMRYHSLPQFVCDFEDCGKRFHQRTLLEHHKLKHENKRQIACTLCGNFFFTQRDVKRHVQRVHAKVSRKCFRCEMTFCRKDKYREHVLKQHKDMTEDERLEILSEIKALKWYEN